MNKLRTLAEILRQAGFAPITCVFLAIFAVCSVVVWLADPETNTLGDGMWFSFQAVSTIGFGDILAAGPVARAVTVVLSIVSIFYIALVTGVVVSYCNEMLKMRQKDTLAHFMDELEHLEEKTPEELANLSNGVKRYRSRL